MGTPKSVGNLGSVTPGKRLPTLSPAAQRLASSKLGIRIGTDKYISRYDSPAYKGSSLHRKRTPSLVSTPNGEATPSQTQHSSISKSIRTSVIKTATPRITATTPLAWNQSEDQSSITDNLLNLPKRSNEEKYDNCNKSGERAKASDFF